MPGRSVEPGKHLGPTAGRCGKRRLLQRLVKVGEQRRNLGRIEHGGINQQRRALLGDERQIALHNVFNVVLDVAVAVDFVLRRGVRCGNVDGCQLRSAGAPGLLPHAMVLLSNSDEEDRLVAVRRKLP
jgi:hypothetical protein